MDEGWRGGPEKGTTGPFLGLITFHHVLRETALDRPALLISRLCPHPANHEIAGDAFAIEPVVPGISCRGDDLDPAKIVEIIVRAHSLPFPGLGQSDRFFPAD